MALAALALANVGSAEAADATLVAEATFGGISLASVDRVEPHQWSVDVRLDGPGSPVVVSLNQDSPSESVQLPPGSYDASIASSDFGGQDWVADVTANPLDLQSAATVNLAIDISPGSQAAEFRVIKEFDPPTSVPSDAWDVTFEVRDAGTSALLGSTTVVGAPGGGSTVSVAFIGGPGTYDIVVTIESSNISGFSTIITPNPITVVTGANADVTITNSPVAEPIPGTTSWGLILLLVGLLAAMAWRWIRAADRRTLSA